MKFLLGIAIVTSLFGVAAANAGTMGNGKFRMADATADACFASCTSQNESRKRVCPATLGAPCLSACDSQAQTCRQGCRSR